MSRTMSVASGLVSETAFAIFWSRMVLPALGGATIKAIEFLIERMKRTDTNKEFFATMLQG